MKFAYKSISFLFLAGLLILIPSSCRKKETAPEPIASEPMAPEPTAAALKPVVEEKDMTPLEIPEYNQALVTFLSGEVLASTGIGEAGQEEWQYVEIGDFLEEEYTLSVGPESYCELQFGDVAALRIQANTEVLLKDVFLKPDEANIGVKLAIGSVLAKVSILAGSDKFTVKSNTAVCGVRGTEFGVRVTEDGKTHLAVREGTVAVLPAGVDLDELKEKIDVKDENLLAALEKIEQAAPIVAAGQEITIGEETLKETEEVFKAVETTVVKILEDKELAVSFDKIEESVEELNKLVEDTNRKVSEVIEPPREISEQSAKELQVIDKIKLVEIPVAPAATRDVKPGQARPEPEVKLEKIAFSVNPREAEIFINGERIGRGRFSGLFSHGESLTVVMKSEGYMDYEFTIRVEKNSGKLYSIILQKKPVPREEIAKDEIAKEEISKEEKQKQVVVATEQTVAKIPKQAEKTKRIVIRTRPDDAEIILDGRVVSRGTYTGMFPLSRSIALQVRRPGYKPQIVTIDVQSAKDTPYLISLKSLPIVRRSQVSEASITGNILVTRERMYVADRMGVLFALDHHRQEKVLWSVSTINSDNENSSPVVIGNNLYFSGSDEFVIVKALTGKVLKRLSLDRDYSHLFGRRIVPFENFAIFPANNNIRLMNLFTGETVKQIAVPGGSRMTPAVYNGRILIVNQEGVFLVINPDNGKIESRIKTEAVQPIAIAVTTYGDRAYFAGRKGLMVCVDLVKEEVRWETPLPGRKERGIFQDLEVGRDGVFSVSDGVLYGYSLDEGDMLFAPVRGATSPPLYKEDQERLYFGGPDNTLLITDTKGRILKELDVDHKITTRPRFEGTNLIVGTDSGELIVINLEAIE